MSDQLHIILLYCCPLGLVGLICFFVLMAAFANISASVDWHILMLEKEEFTMDAIFDMIRAERKRQDDKWGANRKLDNTLWLTILAEKFGEVARAILERDNNLIVELVQVAAVAVCWLESLLSAKDV